MSKPENACAVAAAELETAFRLVETTAMADVPILNKKLSVQCVGMVEFGVDLLCVLITPWFINLLLMPAGQSVPIQPGAKSKVVMPGGLFEFIQSHHDVLGPYRMCSLLSPVFEFDSQEDAVTVAQSILEEVLAPQEAEDTEDADMVAIWEGRLPDVAAIEEAPVVEEVEEPETAAEQKLMSRRALFGLPRQEEATP